MWQIILAVSHAGWLTGERIRSLIFLTIILASLIFVFGGFIRSVIRSRRRLRKLELEYELEQARLAYPFPYYSCEIDSKGKIWITYLRPRKKICVKRRKDHPLTTIFREEMPTRS